MSQYINLRRKHQKLNIGDMRSPITIKSARFRSTTNSADARVDFNSVGQLDVWALINTAPVGEAIFSNTNIARTVTHHVSVRYIPDLTQEAWVEYESDNYDILSVEYLDARKEFQMLRCALTGPVTIPANLA